VAEGEDRGVQAAQQAITSPLTEEGGINGAKGVIFSVAGAEEELGLHEVNEAATMIKEVVAEEADIIWGSFYDNSLEGKLKITVIATGFGKEEKVQKPTPKVIDYEAYRRSPLRRREISRVQQHEKEQEVHKFYNTDIFEIPTFLRKQAD
jgi:cell division protein FtsZ